METVVYTLMKLTGEITAAAVLFMLFWFAFFCGCTGEKSDPSVEEEDPAVKALASLKGGVFSSLSETLELAEKTSGDLSEAGSNKTEAKAILGDSQESLPWIKSAAFIGPDGVVLTIMPGSFGALDGVNLSYQDIVKEGLEKQSPVVSGFEELAINKTGLVLEYPVFSEEGKFSGLLSFVIDPAKMIEHVAGESKTDRYQVMAIQPDGLILYDADAGLIGNETFGNPAYERYPGLITAAEAVSSNLSGTVSYNFTATGSDREVLKTAYWDTVELLDKEWRLVVIDEFSVFIP